MSEYQYYEFRAIDRPLSHSELTELRAISSRAQITLLLAPWRRVRTQESVPANCRSQNCSCIRKRKSRPSFKVFVITPKLGDTRL